MMHHLGIDEDRLAVLDGAVGGLEEIRRDAQIGSDLRHAAGMDDAGGNGMRLLRQFGEIGLGPDDLEGAGVDGLGIAEIGYHFFNMLLGPSG